MQFTEVTAMKMLKLKETFSLVTWKDFKKQV
jgi:hypothetical protein